MSRSRRYASDCGRRRGRESRPALPRPSGCASRSFWGWRETLQRGRALVLLGRHQIAVDADEIGFLVEHEIVVLGAAIGLDPERVGFAVVVARHRPRLRIGMVDGGDPVMQALGVGGIEEYALLDDGPVVGMQRQPAGVERARALEAARLHLERAVAAA